jgi:photosystem II stability/assembly factor-like uncharacterized protein
VPLMGGASKGVWRCSRGRATMLPWDRVDVANPHGRCFKGRAAVVAMEGWRCCHPTSVLRSEVGGDTRSRQHCSS